MEQKGKNVGGTVLAHKCNPNFEMNQNCKEKCVVLSLKKKHSELAVVSFHNKWILKIFKKKWRTMSLFVVGHCR